MPVFSFLLLFGLVCCHFEEIAFCRARTECDGFIFRNEQTWEKSGESQAGRPEEGKRCKNFFASSAFMHKVNFYHFKMR